MYIVGLTNNKHGGLPSYVPWKSIFPGYMYVRICMYMAQIYTAQVYTLGLHIWAQFTTHVYGPHLQSIFKTHIYGPHVSATFTELTAHIYHMYEGYIGPVSV